jgi:hypothetical protein
MRAKSAAAGRKGARNKRTDDLAKYLLQFGEDPLVGAMRLATTQPEILIEASKQEKVHSFSKAMASRARRDRATMTYAEAQALIMRARELIAPYIHGKKPVAIVHDFSGLKRPGDRGRHPQPRRGRGHRRRRFHRDRGHARRWRRGMSFGSRWASARSTLGAVQWEARSDPAPPPHLAGPVADAFLRSRAFICGIIGPVGSGKTLTMLQKLLRGGALQGGRPDAHGIIRRKARYGVIRESYPNIEANILPSWFNLVPAEEGKFNWRAPYVHSFSKVLRRDKETGSRSTSSTWTWNSARSATRRSRKSPAAGKSTRRDRRIRPAAARADQLPLGPRRPLLQPRSRARRRSADRLLAQHAVHRQPRLRAADRA